MEFLNTRGLADRWLCSTRKIEQRRQSGEGPAYMKIGNQVLYSEEVIRAYESENIFRSTAECNERPTMLLDPSVNEPPKRTERLPHKPIRRAKRT